MDIVPEKAQHKTSEFAFDLLVTGITRAQAEEILDLITAKAEEFGGQAGGSFVEAQDGEENA
jgi:hypothetical protein